MRAPVLTLTVDDPRALGRATQPGWSGDFLFGPQANADPWQHQGTEYLPSLKAAAPAGFVVLQDMALQGQALPQTDAATGLMYWDIETGSWDGHPIPIDYGTRFLHMYNGGASETGSVRCEADIPPVWYAVVYCYAMRADRVLPGYWSLTMEGLGGGYPSWQLVVPRGSEQYQHPYLVLDPYGNGYPRPVAICESCNTSNDRGWTEYQVWCELTANQWIIRIAVNGKSMEEPWVYTPSGCDVGNPVLLDIAAMPTPIASPGPVVFETAGQQAMFSLYDWRYPIFSECFTKRFFPIDVRLGDPARGTQPLTADAVAVQPTGTIGGVAYEYAATCEVEVDTTTEDDAIGPRVRFLAQHDGSYASWMRAVCGLVGVTLPAVIGDTETDPWVSTGTNQLGSKVELVRRSTGKGAELRATIRDDLGAIDWKGNNVVTFEVGYQDAGGGAPSLRKLFTGHLLGPARQKEGGDPLLLAIEAQDFAGSRLPRKDMIFSRSFGGLLFETAFRELGNRLGFSDDRIDVHASLAAVYLPTTQIIGEPHLAYGAGDKYDDALDLICKTAGCRWLINADGDLVADIFPAYGGVPDFTLDSTTLDEDDMLWAFEAKSEMGEFANNTYCVTGTEGYRQFGWARDGDSESDDTDDAFVGDNLQLVEILEQVHADADTIATATLGKRAQFAQMLVWKPVTAVEVDPGYFVEAQIANAQVPTGAVYLVTEARDSFELDQPNDFGWEQQFTMVRVQ